MSASPLKRDPALLPVLATIWLSLALFVLYPLFRLFLATFLVNGQWSFANLATVLNNWIDLPRKPRTQIYAPNLPFS